MNGRFRALLTRFGILFLAVGVLVGMVWAFGQVDARTAPWGMARWTMLNVNVTDQQADAHLLQFGDGTNVLIDAAFSGQWLVPALKHRGIRKLDHVILSHPHKDHYGGLTEVLLAGVSVGTIWFNIPWKEVCDPERPWGCDFEDVLRVRKEWAAKGAVLREARAGDVVFSGSRVELRVMVAYDGLHSPIGRTDINDTSLVVKLTAAGTSALFTGDLNQRLGEYLSHDGASMRANLLKVPHHGTEGAAPNSFFNAVAPQGALVPSPARLWNSERSRRIRDYFAAAHIPVWVNGFQGDVRVDFFSGGWLVRPEHGVPVWFKASASLIPRIASP